MATVYRGLKSRVAGIVYGLALLAVSGGGYLFFRENGFVDRPGNSMEPVEWIPVALFAVVALVGLFNVGKALLQDDYRIIVNYHRSDLSVQFGHEYLD